MTHVIRIWLGFAAIGAGLIHLALVVSSPPPIAVVLVALGLAELTWGALTFAKDALIAPTVARFVAVAPIILWSLLVVISTLFAAPAISDSLRLVPMAIAAVFELFVAGVLSVHLRRQQDRRQALADRAALGDDSTPDADAAASVEPPAGRYLLALLAGALIVSSLTTPALAATEAGRFAQPHGDHQSDFVPAPKPDSDPLSGLVLPDHTGH